MANTISTETGRRKYFSSTIAEVLRRSLVSEACFNMDKTGLKRIENPYGSRGTATIHAIGGTYAVSDYTTTDDTLTVVDQVTQSNHVYDFEQVTSAFDMFASRMDQIMFSVKERLDYYAINVITEQATGAYTTPAGGFTTAANINTIFSNLVSKVAGYENAYNGMFLILENTDVVGVLNAQMTNGYSFADAALKNGFVSSYAGVDIYVTRTGTFADATVGTQTFTNSGHRLFGVKNMATVAIPEGVKYDEKKVTEKTGMEIVAYALIGAKVWYNNLDLLVDITLS